MSIESELHALNRTMERIEDIMMEMKGKNNDFSRRMKEMIK